VRRHLGPGGMAAATMSGIWIFEILDLREVRPHDRSGFGRSTNSSSPTSGSLSAGVTRSSSVSRDRWYRFQSIGPVDSPVTGDREIERRRYRARRQFGTGRFGDVRDLLEPPETSNPRHDNVRASTTGLRDFGLLEAGFQTRRLRSGVEGSFPGDQDLRGGHFDDRQH